MANSFGMKHPYLAYPSDFLQSMDQVKNLLIIVAMESEEAALLQGLSVEPMSYGKTFPTVTQQFKLPKCKVQVLRSGVGLVKAGVRLAAVVEHHPVDAIILLGVGGALDPSLSVGDTVVARQVIQHDSISSSENQAQLMAPGELTLSAPPDQQVDPVMRCDSTLVNWVKSAITASGHGCVCEGTILSGSEFAASVERKRSLRKLASDALLVDMEAAALAQLARILKIPFVAAKTVADRAEPDSSIADDYSRFLSAATAHSAGVLKALLKTF